jgi:hypothetical protein
VFTGANVTGAETGAILSASLAKMTKIARGDPGPFIYHVGRSGKPVRMD